VWLFFENSQEVKANLLSVLYSEASASELPLLLLYKLPAVVEVLLWRLLLGTQFDIYDPKLLLVKIRLKKNICCY